MDVALSIIQSQEQEEAERPIAESRQSRIAAGHLSLLLMYTLLFIF